MADSNFFFILIDLFFPEVSTACLKLFGSTSYKYMWLDGRLGQMEGPFIQMRIYKYL